MKIKITRPDGTIVEAEGTPEECAQLLGAQVPVNITTPHFVPYFVPYNPCPVPVVVPYTVPYYPPVITEPTWIIGQTTTSGKLSDGFNGGTSPS